MFYLFRCPPLLHSSFREGTVSNYNFHLCLFFRCRVHFLQ
nr:MAG TPA: hypothetical protein [Caudoviricetes sp.]